MTNVTDLLLNNTVLLLKNGDEDDHHDHDHHDHDDEDDTNGVLIAKLTAMLVLFCASTFFGLLPYKLSKWFKWTGQNDTKSSIIIPLLLSFGGGVLLATTFLHLLPEISINIKALQSVGRLPEFNFHFAEFLMCMGFFAMYLVEEIVHTYLHHRVKSQAGQTTAEGAFQRALSIRGDQKQLSHKKENGNDIDSTMDLVSSDGDLLGNGKIATISTSALQFPRHEDNHRFHHHHHTTHSHHQYTNGHSHSHIPTIMPEEDFIVSSLRGLLIVLALSVHELFEGLAVGLESSESLVWYMFGAVSAHKLVLAFCVGVELVVNKTKMWLTFIYVVTFAVVSPLGIGIGILLSNGNSADATALPSVILQGIASGTLLYVVFFEILSKTGRSDLRQYATVLFGFLLMFGLQFASK